MYGLTGHLMSLPKRGHERGWGRLCPIPPGAAGLICAVWTCGTVKLGCCRCGSKSPLLLNLHLRLRSGALPAACAARPGEAAGTERLPPGWVPHGVRTEGQAAIHLFSYSFRVV